MSAFEPIEITKNFYQLGIPPFPVYLSFGKDAMLIEGGTGGTFEIVVGQIKALGIEPVRIKYLALTHTHADHIGTLPRLKALWPHLQVAASEKAPKIFANEKATQQFIFMDNAIAGIMAELGEIPAVPEPLDEYVFPVDKTVREGDCIDLGDGVCWTAYTVPGHSPCHLAWREEKDEILAIGDTLGYYSPKEDTFWPNYFVSLALYCDSIRKLATLPAKLLALSHNGVIDGDIREFLQKALSATEAYHREMLDRTAKGEDPKAIAKEKGDWVRSIANHMPYDAMAPICRLLIKLSQAAEVENPGLSFKL
jgi:glyoxylase-like metal-dependent hydrolase (beta-lactamase superfamily II)